MLIRAVAAQLGYCLVRKKKPCRKDAECAKRASVVFCKVSYARVATEWRLRVARPFKAGILAPRVETRGYPQPSLRD